MGERRLAACEEDEPRVRALMEARDLARVQYAQAALAQDILRDLIDGIDHGYPLSDGSWEGDVVERAKAVLDAKWTITPPSPSGVSS